MKSWKLETVGEKKMKIQPLLLIFIASIFFTACSTEKRIITLNPIDSLVSDEAKNIQIGGISSLCVDDSLLYVLDDLNADIRIFDIHTLEFNRVIGQKGKGPGELIFPTHILDDDDSLTVLDKMSRKIVKYSKSGNSYREYKVDQLYFCIFGNADSQFALGDLRFPETTIFEISRNPRSIACYPELIDKMDNRKRSNSIPLVNAAKIKDDFYIAYVNPPGVQKLSNNTSEQIDLSLPQHIDKELLQFRTIHEYNGNLLILGFYLNKEETIITNIALLLDNEGNWLKEYILAMPVDEAILTSTLEDNTLYISTHNATIYKYKFK